MKARVEIIPTKRRLGRTNVGERGLFVHPDVAKIHVEVVGEARYVTAEDEPEKQPTLPQKPKREYKRRDLVATQYETKVVAVSPPPAVNPDDWLPVRRAVSLDDEK